MLDEKLNERSINLQFFADGDEGDDAEENKSTGDEDESKDENKDEADEKKYSDDDVDRILNEKFAKWQKKKQDEIDQAKKLADMNAQQKAEYERDQLEEELERYRKADTLNKMSTTARGILKEKGISIDDSVLEILVDEDADKTKEAVDNFAEMFKEAVDKEVTNKLKGPAPKKGTTSTMTKEEIMKIKDRELRQKTIKENIHLFE